MVKGNAGPSIPQKYKSTYSRNTLLIGVPNNFLHSEGSIGVRELDRYVTAGVHSKEARGGMCCHDWFYAPMAVALKLLV